MSSTNNTFTLAVYNRVGESSDHSKLSIRASSSSIGAVLSDPRGAFRQYNRDQVEEGYEEYLNSYWTLKQDHTIVGFNVPASDWAGKELTIKRKHSYTKRKRSAT